MFNKLNAKSTPPRFLLFPIDSAKALGPPFFKTLSIEFLTKDETSGLLEDLL